VRTSLSAFTKASLLSACARNEKLMPTKVRQNSRPNTAAMGRFVGAVKRRGDGCF
jgi:hypothetical protein